MIAVRRHHELGLAGAKRLAESIARRLQNDYGGSYSWKGNELHFGRPGASGSVAVTKDDFQVHVELGLLLRPLSSLIEREIRAFCDEHLGVDQAVGGTVRARAETVRSNGSRPARPRPRQGSTRSE